MKQVKNKTIIPYHTFLLVFSTSIAITACLVYYIATHLTGYSKEMAENLKYVSGAGFILSVAVFFKLYLNKMITITPVLQRLKYTVAILLSAALLSWMTFFISLYFYRNHLVFIPSQTTQQMLSEITRDYPQAQSIHIKTPDGILLKGWFIDQSSHKKAPLTLFFGGAGSDMGEYLSLHKKIPGMSCAFINYRGYGQSEGIPSEEALINDAITVYDYFSSRPKIDPTQIYVIGGSLGTGVAIKLANERPVKALVLFSAYDSFAHCLNDVVPFMPSRLLIKDPFNIVPIAPHIKQPALFLIAAEDKVIRPKRTKTLLKYWSSPYQLEYITGANHQSIYDENVSWEKVNTFLEDSTNLR